MSTPPPDDSKTLVHPAVARELSILNESCEARARATRESVERCHRRISAVAGDVEARFKEQGMILSDHRDRFIELQGRDGKEGKVGALEVEVSRLHREHEKAEEMIHSTQRKAETNASEISRMKATQFRWGAGGATLGGGLVYGIIEAIKHFL